MSIVSWIGLLLVAIGSAFMWNEHRVIRSSEIVPGTVIELVASRGSKGGTVYAPRIRFRTLEGREVIFKSRVSSSSPGVKAGDTVYMAYNRSNPERAKILRFGYTFAVWYCLVGAGLLLIFVSYGFMHGNEWIQRVYLSQVANPRP